MLRTRRVLCGLGLVGAVVALCQFGGAAVAGAQSQATSQRVIVIFKNQETGLPATRSDVTARRHALQGIQAPVTRELSSLGARNVHSYTVLNAVSATVSSSQESQLASNPAVSKVIPDQVIQLAPPASAGSGGSQGGSSGTTVCAPNGQVQLNPQALETIHADSDVPGAKTARSLGFTGAGVTVGFIADGLDTKNPDFIRANGQPVFSDYEDFTGGGTNQQTGGEEAFGDASSIAAQGREIYNVAGYGPHAVTGTCDIRVEGVAPGAGLVGLVAFSNDQGYNSSILAAIDYAVSTDHVNVLNESFGSNYYPDDTASLDVLKQANDNAVAAGTTVVVSSGDAGITSTIGTPSTDPQVLSMGASTTYRINLQDGYGGAQFPGIKGYLNNNISSFSSGGFEQNGRTIDAVAPGELNWALCSTDTAMYVDCFNYAGNPSPVLAFGGTSESAPLTAGEAALVIQAYRQGHGGASPTPAVVKQIIVSTTDDIGSPAEQQGAGLIDAYKAVQAAESYQTPSVATKPTGHTLLTSPTQLNAVGNSGTSERLTDNDHQQRIEHADGLAVYAQGRELHAGRLGQGRAQRLEQPADDQLGRHAGELRAGHVQGSGGTGSPERVDRLSERVDRLRQRLSERAGSPHAGGPGRQPGRLLGAPGQRQLRQPPDHQPEGRHVDRLHLEQHLEQRGIDGSGAVECLGGAVRVVRKRQSEEHDAGSGSVEAGDVDSLDAEFAR